MKLARIIATAGLVIASLGASVTAEAQGRHDRGGYDQRYDRDRQHARRDDHRRDRRHDARRDRRWQNNGRHYGRDRNSNRCRVEWRQHRQVRICR